MNWATVNFGQYKDDKITLPQLIFRDPDYFYWAYTNKAFLNNGSELGRQAEFVYKRSRNILIEKEGHIAEYVYDRRGKFTDLTLIDKQRPAHTGGSLTFRKDRIDMFAVREWKNYDKLGNEILVSCLKYILFGSTKYRLTKKRCEEFFEDDSKFIV